MAAQRKNTESVRIRQIKSNSFLGISTEINYYFKQRKYNNQTEIHQFLYKMTNKK